MRFYSYYFYGLDTPVKIEALNKKQARMILENNFNSLPKPYRESKIVGESVCIPLIGISEKEEGGFKYVWVGDANSRNGWMEESEYLKIVSGK